jgi:RNA polymerase sigma-70 factor (ECF subfamily)
MSRFAPHFLSPRSHTSGGKPIEVSGGRLEALLHRIVDHCEREWPSLKVDRASFVRFLAERCVERSDVEPALRELNVSDLYLCHACAEGAPNAVRVFDERFLGKVGAYISRVDASPEFADEVRQELRTRWLVPSEGDPPRILEYAGTGPLDAWVRVAAFRTALDLQRRRRSSSQAPIGEPDDVSADPEDSLERAERTRSFKRARAGAVAQLSPREREVLRLRYLDLADPDAIAARMGVHRATVVRWISRARQAILSETRERLRIELRLDDEEVESLLQAVQGDTDGSLRRILADKSR